MRLTLEELENLSRLLLSDDQSSVELALELIKNNKSAHQVLCRELVLIAYLYPENTIKDSVYNTLLMLYGERKMRSWEDSFKVFHQLQFYRTYKPAVRQLLKQHENARAQYQPLLERNRHYSLRYSDLGRILQYVFKQHLDLAEQYYRIALAANPNHEQTLFYLAHLLQTSGSTTLSNPEEVSQEVISYYERVLSINPKETSALINLGYEFESLNEYEKSYQFYHQALLIKPDNWEYKRNIARVCIELQGDYMQEAKTLLLELLRIQPNDARVWNSWGCYLWNMEQKYNEAEAAYKRGLLIDNENPYLLGNLGELYIDVFGRVAAGIELYKKALQAKPQNYRLMTMITALVQHQKDYTTARKYYKKLLRNSVDNIVQQDQELKDDQWQAFLAAEAILQEQGK